MVCVCLALVVCGVWLGVHQGGDEPSDMMEGMVSGDEVVLLGKSVSIGEVQMCCPLSLLFELCLLMMGVSPGQFGCS
jgi:hypothetical protein